MTSHVFLATDLQPPLDRCETGVSATLGGDEARHASVKRIEVGERIDLVDGRGLRAHCTVQAVAKSALTVAIDEVLAEPRPHPTLTLVQALAKGGRDEQAVETATEVGIDRVIPWQANRSIVRWAGPKAAKGHAKWALVATAAAKQARRAWVPEVQPSVDSRALAAWIAKETHGGGVVLICHEEATHTLATYLTERAAELAGASSISVVVGPEGGIDPDELAAFTEAGGTPILLGPHVLRSSTAGPVAAALLSAAVGRW